MTTKKTTKVIESAPEVTEEVTFSPKDIAAELGIDAKSFRRWLRSQTTDRANKGGRWIFDAAGKDAFIAAFREKANKVTVATPKAD